MIDRLDCCHSLNSDVPVYIDRPAEHDKRRAGGRAGRGQTDAGGAGRKRPTDYRVVCLVDAQDEDELGEEERGGSVVDDAGLVALHGPQAEEEDGGEEEEAQRHAHRAPGHQLQRQDLAVLSTNRGSGERIDCNSPFTIHSNEH